LQVGEDLLGLRRDITLDDFHRNRMEWNLAGREQKPVGFDGLRVRADGFGCVIGVQCFDAHGSLGRRAGVRAA
jgi:hypothetical protein